MASITRKNIKGQEVTLNDDYMRASDVVKKVGIPRSSLYRMMDNFSFPRSYLISECSVAWIASDIEEFMKLGPAAFKATYGQQLKAQKQSLAA